MPGVAPARSDVIGNGRPPSAACSPRLELARGARRRVELGGVMLFQYKGVEAGLPGEAPRQVVRGAEEEVHAEREIRGVEQRAAPLLDQRADPRELRLPAGGAGDGRHAGLDEPLEVGDHGVGPGELDGDVGAGQALAP